MVNDNVSTDLSLCNKRKGHVMPACGVKWPAGRTCSLVLASCASEGWRSSFFFINMAINPRIESLDGLIFVKSLPRCMDINMGALPRQASVPWLRAAICIDHTFGSRCADVKTKLGSPSKRQRRTYQHNFGCGEMEVFKWSVGVSPENLPVIRMGLMSDCRKKAIETCNIEKRASCGTMRATGSSLFDDWSKNN